MEHCGSGLARDGVIGSDISVERHTAIASKPAPTSSCGAHKIPGKKKPDLANAYNRAAALRSNKCKGRFDARETLKGIRQTI